MRDTRTMKKAQPSAKKEQRSIKPPNQMDRLEMFLAGHERKIFIVLVSIAMLFALLFFNARMSLSGDDASYIERAWDFLHEGKFPYFQGPGYPLFLSVFLKIFGLNIILLKLTSIVCYFGFVWFTYKAFRNRIPFVVLFLLLSFISFNSFFLYYASQTYTECFFMAIQAFCIYVTFVTIEAGNKYDTWKTELRENYLRWILFGFSFLVLYMSKSIAFVCIPAVVLYLLLRKDYRHAAFAFVSFGLFLVIYVIITTSVYGPQDVSQLEMMLRKDIYHPESGHEDFSGMVSRFSNNFITYFGVHALRILNLSNSDPMDFQVDILVLSLSVIFFLFCIYKSYVRNKYVFYVSIYTVAMCIIIFFGVQAANTQDRLIIILMPLVFLVISYVAYEYARRYFITMFVFIFFSLVMLFVTAGRSIAEINKNIPSLKRNIGGDIYYGYSSDWQNFLKMSSYCADSLPPDAVVLSRKPSNSFIYGHGKKFEGQFYVSTRDADSALLIFKNRKIQYVILASLRTDPSVNDGNIITTIHKMVQPISIKYPDKIEVVKVYGYDEYATLCKIHY